MESAQSVTVEVRTNRRGFIGVIAAIVGAVAEVRWRHAQVVIALVTRLWTIPPIREPRWAIHFIGHVSAISVAITPEVRSNAMSRSALERSILALESFAVQLVRVITAIVLVVATPTLGDALSVVAQELRFGALSVFALALRFGLIGTITAIISKIALPLSGEVEKYKLNPANAPITYQYSLWNAPIVRALEVRLLLTGRAILGLLIAAVATIVLSVAEQPLGNAPVVGLARTPLPSRRAIPLSTHVRWLI